MGCDCWCHDKFKAAGVNGCCWECEKEHDPLRKALLQVGILREALEGVAKLEKALGPSPLLIVQACNIARAALSECHEKQSREPECTCSIDGTPYCKAKGTGHCKAENPTR
jgi:hypothetical protein